MLMALAVIDAAEERIVRAYHTATSYQADEAAERLQEPRISKDEVEAEVHDALITSVMVGAPI